MHTEMAKTFSLMICWLCTMAMARIVVTTDSILAVRSNLDYANFSDLQARANNKKRPADSPVDNRAPRRARMRVPSRSPSLSPPPRPPAGSLSFNPIIQLSRQGMTRSPSPRPRPIHRLGSTDTSDSDANGAENTVKATVKGKGMLNMTPWVHLAQTVNSGSTRKAKDRGARVEATTITTSDLQSNQQAEGEIVAKGGQVKATIRPENSGEIEAWGAEGYQRIYSQGGRTARLRAKATLNEDGEVGRRARVKATIAPQAGGQISAVAQGFSRSPSSTTSSSGESSIIRSDRKSASPSQSND